MGSLVSNEPNSNGMLPTRLAVIAVYQEKQKFLVIRRARHLSAGGKLCFPGGYVEPGESEVDALQRELREELAVDA